jgi:hypothetical protein
MPGARTDNPERWSFQGISKSVEKPLVWTLSALSGTQCYACYSERRIIDIQLQCTFFSRELTLR